MNDQAYVLPPHFEVVTFPWRRWLEVFYSLTDQRGDSTVGTRALIWDALQLNRTEDRDAPMSIVLIANSAASIRWWEKTRVDE